MYKVHTLSFCPTVNSEYPTSISEYMIDTVKQTAYLVLISSTFNKGTVYRHKQSIANYNHFVSYFVMY